jgi:DNA-binding CsgD family transcriptional regulator
VATGELTPTERQIAELVAQGHTNREVAERLFVRMKTIEWNLSKIYRKVGVRTRRELSRRLAGDGRVLPAERSPDQAVPRP